MNRLPAETHRIETDYGTLYGHIQRDLQGRPVGFALSHQIKDMNSQLAEFADDIARGVDAALKP